MKNNKLITFVIVTWNNEKQIEACLDTLAKYTITPHEIIVVDNVSEDKTCDIISRRYPFVRLIKSKENLGFARGNNLALKEVRTPYLCFINPDVILTEDIASPAINILNQHKDVGLVTNKLCNIDGSSQLTTGRFTDFISIFISVCHLSLFIPNLLRKNLCPEYYEIQHGYYFPDWVIGAEMFMRTSDAKEISGFSTDYYMYMEDMDICWKIRHQLQKKILYNSDVSMIHLGGASEKQNKNYSKQEKLYVNTFLFCKKYYGKKKAYRLYAFITMLYKIRRILIYPLKLINKRNDLLEHEKNIRKILKNIES
ncbi:glycosyltransferase family 2 protein [uncultured Mitsuokella sp.]|uniref:glycosyltransferase family 2 protein n=1 Tax=uncultured Mitsuokella sp. TaxID=453120 RepID=UPI0026DD6B34|nr:glycosyltransferase family 2 protein [uncultured Mitsuokella sp.]